MGGLISYLKRHRSSVIAMDNCTVHNLARTSFQETGITVLPWPAKSPDLMPVENLWSIMDNFKNSLAPRNHTDLIITIEAAFQDLQTTFSIASENTMKSFRKRCRIVIEKNGGNCNYYYFFYFFPCFRKLQIAFGGPLSRGQYPLVPIAAMLRS